MTLVLVEWIDCWGDIPGWVIADDIISYRPDPVKSVGWLVSPESHSIDGCVVLSSSKIGEKLGGIMVIPAVNILSMTLLDEP